VIYEKSGTFDEEEHDICKIWIVRRRIGEKMSDEKRMGRRRRKKKKMKKKKKRRRHSELKEGGVPV